MKAIEVKGLTKRYKSKTAVDDLSFAIEPGRIVGLIGPNGSGKTTTLKALTGQITFDGEVSICGMKSSSDRRHLMREVSYVADVAVLPRWATARQLISLMAGLHPRFDSSRARELLAKTNVDEGALVRNLSKGMVVQLHLSLMMAVDAKVLVLDEPTLGLDPLFRKEFYRQLLEDFVDEERTIIISTHQIDEIEHVVSDVIFLKDGKLALHDSMDNLAQRFQAVWVSPASVQAAMALKPIEQRTLFGKKVMLFEGRSEQELSGLGELQYPSLTDIFTSKMGASA